jgi:hypothetical protein
VPQRNITPNVFVNDTSLKVKKIAICHVLRFFVSLFFNPKPVEGASKALSLSHHHIMKNYIVLTALVAIAIIASCKKDVDCTEENLTSLSDKIASTATTYFFDQSAANCNALKDAYNAYLDVAEECSSVTQSEIDDARTALEGLTCQ